MRATRGGALRRALRRARRRRPAPTRAICLPRILFLVFLLLVLLVVDVVAVAVAGERARGHVAVLVQNDRRRKTIPIRALVLVAVAGKAAVAVEVRPFPIQGGRAAAVVVAMTVFFLLLVVVVVAALPIERALDAARAAQRCADRLEEEERGRGCARARLRRDAFHARRCGRWRSHRRRRRRRGRCGGLGLGRRCIDTRMRRHGRPGARHFGATKTEKKATATALTTPAPCRVRRAA